MEVISTCLQASLGDLPVVYSLDERGSFSLARAIKVACLSDDNKIA